MFQYSRTENGLTDNVPPFGRLDIAVIGADFTPYIR
uniref:Agmatinase n=1 Tax=Steinernema glaseri TaxID=37863 RepID=A0A1I7ZND7_9BILA